MDETLQDLADKAVSYSLELGVKYCDVRAEIQRKKSITIENGNTEHIREIDDRGLGIRLLMEGGAWRFFSISNPCKLDEIKNKIDQSISKSSYSDENKNNRIQLHPIPTYKAEQRFPVLKRPNIQDLIDIGLECNKIILEKPRITKALTNTWYSENSKYFVNSEGSEILQEFTDVIMDMTATAHETGVTQSINITEGGRGGLEVLVDKEKVQSSANEISNKTSELIYAKPAKEEKTTVIMNPDFVALLTHEILGHPSEADRVLGKEMAWAGGAWWKGKIGKKIGSDSLNVFDDPTINHTLGWYYYDDEGVKTQRTSLVEHGILVGHMQNRETSETFCATPTGNMRATNYRFMPLIRMACTCIGEGDWNQKEMIKDVKKGYMISNMKIPSIDMKRHNWSISCQYAQKIENGELTDLLRDVIIMGTAPEFFNSIDACGNDFTIRPITNCGKGDPMQSMIMGNGGPTIRGTATVKSVN